MFTLHTHLTERPHHFRLLTQQTILFLGVPDVARGPAQIAHEMLYCCFISRFIYKCRIKKHMYAIHFSITISYAQTQMSSLVVQRDRGNAETRQYRYSLEAIAWNGEAGAAVCARNNCSLHPHIGYYIHTLSFLPYY